MQNLLIRIRRAYRAFNTKPASQQYADEMKTLMSKLTERYKQLLSDETIQFEDKDRIISMLQVIEEKSETLPSDKLNRWMGFIQGVLYRNNLISIDVERDVTRPWFHKFYRDTLQHVPKSIDVTKNA